MEKTPYLDPCTIAMQEDMRQLKEMIASDLSQYMLEMMPDLNDCVDWVCDRFGLDATDELIDFVADCHDEFFGNWLTCEFFLLPLLLFWLPIFWWIC